MITRIPAHRQEPVAAAEGARDPVTDPDTLLQQLGLDPALRPGAQRAAAAVTQRRPAADKGR
ncbi:EF-P beta-lysylation protein EpmB, partial [Ectothiorhodospira mobilis]|nr:EF-P beta-lysylation protein EpmB [Ectothiorhodospira mobilis]